MRITPAQKRLKTYILGPKKYWVEFVAHGAWRYYTIHEAKVGVIDKITEKTFDKAIELGIITYEQYRNNQQL